MGPKKDSPPIFKNLIRIRDELIEKSGTAPAALALLTEWSTSRGAPTRTSKRDCELGRRLEEGENDADDGFIQWD